MKLKVTDNLGAHIIKTDLVIDIIKHEDCRLEIYNSNASHQVLIFKTLGVRDKIYDLVKSSIDAEPEEVVFIEKEERELVDRLENGL